MSISTTPAGKPATVAAFTYDADGKVTQQKLDGQVLATPTYSSAQELSQVVYQGGSKLNSDVREFTGAGSAFTPEFADVAGQRHCWYVEPRRGRVPSG